MKTKSGRAAVHIVNYEPARAHVFLDDNDAVLVEPSHAFRKEVDQVGVRQMAEHPLAPDNVVPASTRNEILQPADVAVAHLLARNQVHQVRGFRKLNELARLLDYIYLRRKLRQQVLRHPPDPRPAIERN
ncbi:hypothetical protein AYI69_g10066 [Smittium culicis]|uniref:Uncharacterized protein n=1 Tax=Smittium culicis TaxID=133412 RepID=A0A1R1X8A5_9FUNG|nr:hypothetical protein AYI69_g10066 [Smittium culicis]